MGTLPPSKRSEGQDAQTLEAYAAKHDINKKAGIIARDDYEYLRTPQGGYRPGLLLI